MHIQGEVSLEKPQTAEVSGEDRRMDVPFDPMGEGAWGRARAGTGWLVVWSVIPPLHSGFGNAQQSLTCNSSFSLAAPRLPQWKQHFGILVSVTWGLGGHSELLHLSPDSAGCDALGHRAVSGAPAAPTHPLCPCVSLVPMCLSHLLLDTCVAGQK